MSARQPLPSGYSAQNPNFNHSAIASLVLGLVGFFFTAWGIVPLFGVIIGIIAVLQRDQYGRRPRGFGLAIAGLIIATLSLLFALLVIIITISGTLACSDGGALAQTCHPTPGGNHPLS